MTRSFERLEAQEFAALAATLPMGRRLTEVHLHHTWKPRQVDYDPANGERTIQSMWRYHTEERGFSDIAQHVTVAPDGAVWLGRSFDKPPASAVGFNGNRTAGPFMIEMIGDFDRGREVPTEAQMRATLIVIRAVQRRFELPASALRFHNEMSGKTCPGDSMDKADIVARIEATELPQPRSGGVFEVDATRLSRAARAVPPDDGRADVEPAELDHGATTEPGGRAPSAAARGLFTSRERRERIARWRDHWISLEDGQFSDGGLMRSSQADVDRIFKERLPEAIAAAKARGEPLRLMVYAHGGLVPERSGIDGMLDQIEIWDDNGVYPLFFVWETGFLPSIIDGIGARGTRAAWSDRVIEELSRYGGGRLAWKGMKASAHAANTGTGGALTVNRALRELAAEAGDDLSINLVGHSAGSIFHAHFVEDLAIDAKKTKLAVDNLVLLAPAIRNSLFSQLVLPRMRDGLVRRATIFTMNDALERMDPTIPAYSKSLLYLIRGALEPERRADILGLEISLRRDAALSEAFGLMSAKADSFVVFSGDPGSSGAQAEVRGRASTATTHGGFDNDAPTMNSVLRLILGRENGEPIVPFPPEAPEGGDRGGPSGWSAADFLSEELREELAAMAPPPPQAAPYTPPPRPAARRRRALCIGINDYRALSPLRGCVADAALWADTLGGLGYAVERMAQEDATGHGMLQRIGGFLDGARPGDHLVLQFAGHGVGFADLGGDEPDAQDEAMCGIDFNAGDPGFVLDDEIRALYAALPEGVEVTSFVDCCHSGSMARMALRSRSVGLSILSDLRSRHADRVDPIAKEAHRRRAAALPRGEVPMRGIHFGACTDSQLANESAGQGHFTLAAVAALRQGGRPTNAEFMERVAGLIKPYPMQTPVLDARAGLWGTPLSVLS